MNMRYGNTGKQGMFFITTSFNCLNDYLYIFHIAHENTNKGTLQMSTVPTAEDASLLSMYV